MSSTTALQGFPYPVGSTDAPDGPAQILALANAAEKRVVMVFATASARTSAFTAASVTPTEGMVSYQQDSNLFYWYTGAQWFPVPGQKLDSDTVTTAQTLITAETDLTGLTNVVTTVAGQPITITAYGLLASTVAADRLVVRLKEGATVLQQAIVVCPSATVASAHFRLELPDFVPSAAAHTYKLSLERVTGTGNASLQAGATSPAFIRTVAA